MSVRIFKLIGGEEIISAVTAATDEGFELDNPATIMLQQTEKGVGVSVAPYLPYAEGSIFLYSSAIAATAIADTNMMNEYNRIFGSGIQIASAGSIQNIQ